MAAAVPALPKPSTRQLVALMQQAPDTHSELLYCIQALQVSVPDLTAQQKAVLAEPARRFFSCQICADVDPELQGVIDTVKAALERPQGYADDATADVGVAAQSTTQLPKLQNGQWLNTLDGDPCKAISGKIVMEMGRTSDMWQRTYYGFRFNSCPAYVWECETDSTFSAAAHHAYGSRFDQCGLLIYLDEDCWAKASIEWETDSMSHLGSVVTNGGFSDWATQEVASTPVGCTWYRVSRRGADFCFEWSSDAKHWAQLRVFHLGGSVSPAGVQLPVQVGVYAGSPVAPTCKATFTDMKWETCQWAAHEE